MPLRIYIVNTPCRRCEMLRTIPKHKGTDQLQLVDLPAVSTEHPVPWLASALQTADACLLVVDLGESSCVGQVQAVHAILGAKHVTLSERWGAASANADAGDGEPFVLRIPALMLANKADLAADEAAEVEVFRELTGLNYRGFMPPLYPGPRSPRP